MPYETSIHVARLLGSIGGSIMSVAFRPPKTIKEFARRSLFSAIAGYTICGAALHLLKLDNSFDFYLASSTLIAFMSWWIAGPIIKRLIREL